MIKRMKWLLCVLLLGVPAMAQSNTATPAVTVTGTGTSATTFLLGRSWSGGALQVTGASLTTATFTMQGSPDGTNWSTLALTPCSTPLTTSTTVTVTGTSCFQVNLLGMAYVQYVFSGTFTATSVTLQLWTSPNALVGRNSGASGGSVGGASNLTTPNSFVYVSPAGSLNQYNGTACVPYLASTATPPACATRANLLGVITPSTTPPLLQYLGTGADGANTNASGNLAGVYYYTNFTVPYGNTVSTGGSTRGLVIHATGTCTIAGSITGNSAGQSHGGGSGGGGGGGTAAGSAGGATVSLTGGTIQSGGTLGAASGGNGGSGAMIVTGDQRIFINGLNGGDGTFMGGATGGQGGSSGGAGGAAGSAVVLICNTITGTDGTHTGSISVAGGAGGASTGNNIGAGGGGGGGVIILSSQTGITTPPTLTVSGGSGGSCGAYTGCGTGGNGGNGWSATFGPW